MSDNTNTTTVATIAIGGSPKNLRNAHVSVPKAQAEAMSKFLDFDVESAIGFVEEGAFPTDRWDIRVRLSTLDGKPNFPYRVDMYNPTAERDERGIAKSHVFVEFTKDSDAWDMLWLASDVATGSWVVEDPLRIRTAGGSINYIHTSAFEAWPDGTFLKLLRQRAENGKRQSDNNTISRNTFEVILNGAVKTMSFAPRLVEEITENGLVVGYRIPSCWLKVKAEHTGELHVENFELKLGGRLNNAWKVANSDIHLKNFWRISTSREDIKTARAEGKEQYIWMDPLTNTYCYYKWINAVMVAVERMGLEPEERQKVLTAAKNANIQRRVAYTNATRIEAAQQSAGIPVSTPVLKNVKASPEIAKDFGIVNGEWDTASPCPYPVSLRGFSNSLPVTSVIVFDGLTLSARNAVAGAAGIADEWTMR